MSLSKKLYYGISAALPTAFLRKMASSPMLLPYHHLVSDQDLPHIKHLYPYKNISQFRQDLDYLLGYYKPVTASEVADALNHGRSLPKHSFLLSFDDGFREVHDVIAPILLEKGIPAVFFVNPAFLDNQQLFYRCKISLLIDKLKQQVASPIQERCAAILKVPADTDTIAAEIKKITNLNKQLLDELALVLGVDYQKYLQQQRPFLTKDQVKKLVEQGFEVGAHSWDHPYYHLIADDEKINQTMRSTEYVTDHFFNSGKFFSFPHSDQPLSQSFFDSMPKNAGIDVFFGVQNQKHELNNKVLHRFNAERPDLPMKKQLNGILVLMILRQMLGRDRVVRN
jgi:peptidoglycan/xylan/chitin deacetylase (PgdA/CDA1 family)